MAHDIVRACAFSTRRLMVGEWHDIAGRSGLDLVDSVCAVLTRATTGALPADWQGDFDAERAEYWIEARDAESPTSLAIDRQSGQPIGLLILFEAAAEDHRDQLDIRLGYIVAESVWGRGLASELVGGFVTWALAESTIASISGGVASRNMASVQVLHKNGFHLSESRADEHEYRLMLRDPPSP
jgi:ribosomal-protein-alanine N-acetyltransferase